MKTKLRNGAETSSFDIDQAGKLNLCTRFIKGRKRGNDLEVVPTIARPVVLGNEESSFQPGIDASRVRARVVERVQITSLLGGLEVRTCQLDRKVDKKKITGFGLSTGATNVWVQGRIACHIGHVVDRGVGKGVGSRVVRNRTGGRNQPEMDNIGQ